MQTHRRWTLEELDRLEHIYSCTRSVRDIEAAFPGRALHSIRAKANELGLYREQRSTRSDGIWQEQEIEHLKKVYPHTASILDVQVEFPQYTLEQIRNKARHLGLRRTASLGEQEPLSLSPTQAAYIAGLIDGEGSITLKSTHNRKRTRQLQLNPAVFIYNSNTDVLHWLKATVPGFSAVRERGGKWARNGNKPVHEWKVGGFKGVAQLLRVVLPYLIIKRRQAELLLGFCENRVQFSEYTDAEVELWETLKEVNRRGV